MKKGKIFFEDMFYILQGFGGADLRPPLIHIFLSFTDISCSFYLIAIFIDFLKSIIFCIG